jgi:hypothetical protein
MSDIADIKANVDAHLYVHKLDPADENDIELINTQ